MTASSVHVREEGRGARLSNYAPLLVLICVSILVAMSVGHALGGGLRAGMSAYMGFFLSVFALLKLFDLKGFADGFHMYDLFASRWRPYGYVYPFLELGLGLAWFAMAAPVLTAALTIALFAFGAVGVVKAMSRHLDIDCPCMGNVLRAPLSAVTLTEDVAMIGMGLVMLTSWLW